MTGPPEREKEGGEGEGREGEEKGGAPSLPQTKL